MHANLFFLKQRKYTVEILGYTDTYTNMIIGTIQRHEQFKKKKKHDMTDRTPLQYKYDIDLKWVRHPK